jgi:hypothetical protein
MIAERVIFRFHELVGPLENDFANMILAAAESEKEWAKAACASQAAPSPFLCCTRAPTMPQFGTSAEDDDDQLWATDDKQVNTTDFTEMYSTSTGAMTRDLDDPYAFEKKPLHYIPGYTGHLPLNRERFGINYREASADTIAMQKKRGVHNPVVPLDQPPPNYVRTALASSVRPRPRRALWSLLPPRRACTTHTRTPHLPQHDTHAHAHSPSAARWSWWPVLRPWVGHMRERMRRIRRARRLGTDHLASKT